MSVKLINKFDVGRKFVCRDGKTRTIIGYDPRTDWPWEIDAGYTVDENGIQSVNHAPGEDVDLLYPYREAQPASCVAGVEQLSAAKDGEHVPVSAIPQNVLRTLPANTADRKGTPVVTGCLDYFPLAVAEIARISKAGNDQHNPGQPLHWARDKSNDHVNCLGRHLLERGTIDVDGERHTAKAAWRALALLQEELEAEAGWTPVPSPENE